MYKRQHDNQTLLGWCEARYPDRAPRECAEKIAENVMMSRAAIVIMPLQDVLGLGDEARMNTPGTTGRNWSWQAKKEDFAGAAQRLRSLTERSGRCRRKEDTKEEK